YHLHVQEQTAILGTITIGGSISGIDNLSDLLQVCMDVGAKKVLIPISVASKMSTVPPDLFSKFQISFPQLNCYDSSYPKY
ncbi:MAG: hypothetical protein C5S46_05180, partial [Candidatus Methanomarinus sp.]